MLERGDNPEKKVEMGEIDVEMGVATFLSLYNSIRFTVCVSVCVGGGGVGVGGEGRVKFALLHFDSSVF